MSATKTSDVDSLIDRHRKRLEGHRKFLDGDAAKPYHSTQLEIRESVWRQDGAASSTTAAATVENGDIIDQQTRSKNHSVNKAAENQKSPRTPNGGQLHSNYSAANKNGSLDRHSHIDMASFAGTAASTVNRQQPQQHVTASSSHQLGSSSYSPSPIEQQAISNGRYFTNSPTRMFDRSQAWLANRERNLIDTYHESNKTEDHECTFQPETHTDEYMAKFQHHHFAPPSMIDVGEANFIERQRIARMLKNEACRKMVPDTSRWENRRTVPKEFDLNKRDTAIPSLKRPIGAQVAAILKSKVAPKSGASSTSGSAPNTPRGATSQPKAASTKPLNKSDSKKNDRVESKGDEEFQPAARDDENNNTQQAKLQQRHYEEMSELKEMLQRQQEQIATLTHGLSLAQRELVVARATIRDLSLNPYQ